MPRVLRRHSPQQRPRLGGWASKDPTAEKPDSSLASGNLVIGDREVHWPTTQLGKLRLVEALGHDRGLLMGNCLLSTGCTQALDERGRISSCGKPSLLPAWGPPHEVATHAETRGASPRDWRHSMVLAEAGEQGTGALASGRAGGPGEAWDGKQLAAPALPSQGPGEETAAPWPASQQAGLITAGVGGRPLWGTPKRMRRFVQ